MLTAMSPQAHRTPLSIESDVQRWTNTVIRPTEAFSAHDRFLLDSVSSWTATADEQLQEFRVNMANNFPFVVVPPGTDAAELRATRPNLYDAIMMITTYRDASRQSKLRNRFIQIVMKQLFMEGKKSLDLLQGLLVFIAWYHHYLAVSPQLTNMIQLSAALIFDLGLHRNQGTGNFHDHFVNTMRFFNDKRAQTSRTSDEKRAYLGLFYITNT